MLDSIANFSVYSSSFNAHCSFLYKYIIITDEILRYKLCLRFLTLPKVIQRQSGIGMDAILYFRLQLWCFSSNFLFWKFSKVQRFLIVQWTSAYLTLSRFNSYQYLPHLLYLHLCVWSWHFSIRPGQVTSKYASMAYPLFWSKVTWETAGGKKWYTWDGHVHTAIMKMNKQQGPTL